ncbi:ribonucleotide reductase of class Ia (aerobic), beta subunit [Escherichia phage A73]|uniref:ribonucleoside-diphosphate reductase n=1 Tax=Escherichia phage A73 TaxID=3003819 RepID=A0AAE9VXE8_9CAUD|nr:ribonucleotide reductase of class Ia (aerobic), beta subunit [Escherichia phage A73]WBF77997.1 ribonucleotide reductase of class Ia (aerobic), beta subunit [Escherichia phage W70]
MSYTTFNKNQFDFMEQPMFFGESVNVSRYDKQKHNKFEKLTEKQLAFFWRPEEIDVTRDRIDFMGLPDHEKHIFISNLKYQTLLDSVQGRGPNAVLLPIVSDPALETWIETWGFSETIHSRSYTHIIRNVFSDPSAILDEIMKTPEILERADAVTRLYDDLFQLNSRYALNLSVDRYAHARALYLCMHSINALEAIRFYVSFACSFAFGERSIMTGNTNIIELIARDEALHLSGTQYILNEMQSGREGDLIARVAEDCKDEARELFLQARQQERDWAEYLFKDGSMVGLNKEILWQYVDYMADQRMRAVGLDSFISKPLKNPIPWINSHLNTKNVQVTPQELENGQYLSGQVDSSVSASDFDFEL